MLKVHQVLIRKDVSYIKNQRYPSRIIDRLALKESRKRGDNGLFTTLVPKVNNNVFLIRWLNNFGDFYWILIGWFIKMSIKMFQPLILIYRSDINLLAIVLSLYIPGKKIFALSHNILL